jgi:phosphate uptake regulator
MAEFVDRPWMGGLPTELSQATESVATRNVTVAQNLVGLDGEINRLNREIFNRAVEAGGDLEVRE